MFVQWSAVIKIKKQGELKCSPVAMLVTQYDGMCCVGHTYLDIESGNTITN